MKKRSGGDKKKPNKPNGGRLNMPSKDTSPVISVDKSSAVYLVSKLCGALNKAVTYIGS